MQSEVILWQIQEAEHKTSTQFEPRKKQKNGGETEELLQARLEGEKGR